MNFDSYTDRSVAVAVDLANTFSPVSETEKLVTPADLAAFLLSHEMRPNRPPTERDVAEVRSIRERLRQAFQAEDEKRATAVLNSLLRDVDAHPHLSGHDGEPFHIHYAPTEAPIARHVAATGAMGLAVVIAEGGYDRLGVCAWERCQDVFVDASRNRSRRYCDPAVCGNRASVAAHRRRQKESAAAQA